MKPMTSDELKAAFAALPPMDPVEPEHSWKFWAWDLRQNVSDKDPAEFLTWPGVVGTMFVGNAPYIRQELSNIKITQNIEDYIGIEGLIKEPQFGSPELFETALCSSSGNLIHQLYHLSQIDIQMSEIETIIEVGGGYGAMALICHRLGFKGRYIIYDLPEFSLLQQYYLSNVGVENVEFKTQITEPINCDLLIGLYSLSEMPMATRERILGLCRAKSYLLAYGANWGGWDNAEWASDMMRRKDYNWRNWNIEHLANCWYLTGDRRE